jgi:hypothetical protein
MDSDAPTTASRYQAELLEVGHRTRHGLSPNVQHLRKFVVVKVVREVRPVAAWLRLRYELQEPCAEPNEYGLRKERLKLAVRRRQTTAQFSKQLHQHVWPSSDLPDQEIRSDFADFGPFDRSGAVVLDSTPETELAEDLARSVEFHNDFIPGCRDVGQLHEAACQEKQTDGGLSGPKDPCVASDLSRRTREQ